ncbi:MAG: carboxypeptidase regulatory-like domain-containing protein [Bryobacteraceae bacterium]|jgi:hypothetical protein
MSRLVTILALILLAASAVFGQAVAIGSVSGTIMDPSGSSIPGATARITEVDKGIVHTVTSNADGRYAFFDLPVGPYRLEVQAKGFKDYVQTGIVLQVAENITQNVALQVGAMTETVQVHAASSMVETKDSSISQVISQQPIVDLPLNGRNPADLLALSGLAISQNSNGNASMGMTLNGGDLTGSKNIQGSSGSGQYSVAGSAANGVNFLLDGGDNNDAFSNVNLPIPFPDALQEFSVQTEGLPAQYGLHPGGVVNIVTKSGTNELHGDLFYFLRNGDLNARQEGTLVRDTLKRNQFGGTVGDRIIKDKLFFFAGYQGTRQRSDPATNIAYVPTPAALKGDFSLLDGATSSGGCLTKARQLKDPSGKAYPGNQIPVTSFDPAGLKLASTYLPPAINSCGEAFFGYASNNPDDQIIGRVDYNISSSQAAYFRYFIYDFTAQSLFDGHNALTTGSPGSEDRSQTATFGDTYTFSGSTLNSFHATFDRRRDNRSSAANMFSPATLGVNMYLNQPNYTQLSVSSYSGSGFNIGCGTCALANFDINTYQVADDFLFVRGKHEIAVGFDGRKDQFNSYNNQQSNGQFTFNGSVTGDGLADLLIGRFNGLTDGNVISDYLRQTVMAAYVQDGFHVTPRFSINLGVRWEPSVPSYDKYGRGNQFSWPLFLQGWHSSCEPNAPAGLIFSCDTAQDPYGKAFTASHWATFSPRLGLVLDPKGDGKQTLRASFALLHDTTELFYPERWTTNSPYVSSISLTSGQFSNPFSSYTLNGVTGDPFPGASVFPTQGAYVSVPPNLKVTYMMQWNLSYQRQVKDWLLTANYLGNVSRHIWGSTDINYALPIAGASTSNTNNRRLTYLDNATAGKYYADIQQTDDGANASYNALAVRAEHRMGNHFQVLANYTWSHCISTWDFAGELAGPIYMNPVAESNGERGNCGYDHRHVFHGSVVAISPGFGPGAARLVTKDWQISPVVSVFTGNPIEIEDGKDISLYGQNLDRPLVVGQVIPAQQTVQEWFNPLALVFAPAGTFGNLARNSVYGPGQIDWDMAVSRAFQLRERWKLEFRADFFNIMNHGNPSGVSSTVSNGNFGQITSFTPPRFIQMAMKLYF